MACPPTNIRLLTCDDSITVCEILNTVAVSGSFEVGSADSATITAIGASITTIPIAPANPLRKSLILFNNSSATAYVSYAPTSSPSLFTHKLIGNEGVELPTPVFNGTVSCIWDAALGNMMITEMT